MCTYTPFNTTKSSKNISEDELCWENSDLDRFDAYRVALAGFIVLLGKKLNVLKVDLFSYFKLFNHLKSLYYLLYEVPLYVNILSVLHNFPKKF